MARSSTPARRRAAARLRPAAAALCLVAGASTFIGPSAPASAESAPAIDADVPAALAGAGTADPVPLVFAHRQAGGGLSISTAVAGSAAEGQALLAVAGAAGDLTAVSLDVPVSLLEPAVPTGAVPIGTVLNGTVPNGTVPNGTVPNGTPAEGRVRVEGAAGVASASNDAYRPYQWALDAVAFEAAWATADGSGVTVAVLDTGVDTGHPDLAPNLAATSRHFLHDGANNALVGPDVEDGQGHGTHVAGTIAAAAGNGAYVTGAAPGATILPVKVLDDTGSGWLSDVAAGIVWATDNGADVINMSLGAAMASPDQVLHDAVEHAYNNGVVLFAAAGNSGCDVGAGCPPNWPAAEAHVIAVGSLGGYGAGGVDPTLCSSYSTRAAYVDLAAPGYSVYSTYPRNKLAQGVANLSGTSMATPHAAAAAAIVLADDPTLSPAAVLAALTTTAHDVGSAGVDTCTGAGAIDPLAAIGAAPTTTTSSTATTTPAPPAAPQLTAALAGRAMVRLTFRVGGAHDEVRLYRDGDLVASGGPATRNLIDRNVPAGTHTYTVRTLRNGLISADSNAVTARPR